MNNKQRDKRQTYKFTKLLAIYSMVTTPIKVDLNNKIKMNKLKEITNMLDLVSYGNNYKL